MGPTHDIIRTVRGELCGSETTPANDAMFCGLESEHAAEMRGNADGTRQVGADVNSVIPAGGRGSSPLDPPGVRAASRIVRSPESVVR
jgi:hypothetical protein